MGWVLITLLSGGFVQVLGVLAAVLASPGIEGTSDSHFNFGGCGGSVLAQLTVAWLLRSEGCHIRKAQWLVAGSAGVSIVAAALMGGVLMTQRRPVVFTW